MSTGPLAEARERLYRLPGARPPGRPRKAARVGQAAFPEPPLEAAVLPAAPASESRNKRGPKIEAALPPRLVQFKIASAYLGIAPRTFSDLVAAGTIKTLRLPGVRLRLVDVRDLDRLIEEAKA